jgi:uncharacterized membrane protein
VHHQLSLSISFNTIHMDRKFLGCLQVRELCVGLDLDCECAIIAASLFRRALKALPQEPPTLSLVAIVSVLLATKVLETQRSIDNLLQVCALLFTSSASVTIDHVRNTEMQIVIAIGFETLQETRALDAHRL